MSKKAKKAAIEAYPVVLDDVTVGFNFSVQEDVNSYPRGLFQDGYEQAEKDIVEHCETRIAEYNANNLSNMFLRRAFEDVIRFIKEIPYKDHNDE